MLPKEIIGLILSFIPYEPGIILDKELIFKIVTGDIDINKKYHSPWMSILLTSKLFNQLAKRYFKFTIDNILEILDIIRIKSNGNECTERIKNIDLINNFYNIKYVLSTYLISTYSRRRHKYPVTEISILKLVPWLKNSRFIGSEYERSVWNNIIEYCKRNRIFTTTFGGDYIHDGGGVHPTIHRDGCIRNPYIYAWDDWGAVAYINTKTIWFTEIFYYYPVRAIFPKHPIKKWRRPGYKFNYR